MSVSAETYIVISLMFAVFAAVAAVGTSVVLGAGFERLRAGFDLIKRQSGFFADAIHKLDQRTQKLDEETAKLKAGVYGMSDRVDRVEKQTGFMVEAVQMLEQRILVGTPAAKPEPARTIRMHPVNTVSRSQPPKTHSEPMISAMPQDIGWTMPQVREQENSQPDLSMERKPLINSMFAEPMEMPEAMPVMTAAPAEESGSLTSLLSRYWMGEQSGGTKGVVYH